MAAPDLTISRPSPELLGQLHQLRAPGRADRMSLGQQAAAGIDRNATAELRRATGQQLWPVTGRA